MHTMINSNEKQSNKIAVHCSRRSCKTPDEQVRRQKKFEAQNAAKKRGAYNRHKCIRIHQLGRLDGEAGTRAHAWQEKDTLEFTKQQRRKHNAR